MDDRQVEEVRSGQWFAFGSGPHARFVRKTQLYRHHWPVDLYDGMVSAAPFGGPVAALMPRSKTIDVYSASGNKLHEFAVPAALPGVPSRRSDARAEEVVSIGWSCEESLLVLTTHGRLVEYALNTPRDGCAGCSRTTRIVDDPDAFSVCYATLSPNGVAVQDEELNLVGAALVERRPPLPFTVSLSEHLTTDVACLETIPQASTLEGEHALLVAPARADAVRVGALLLVNASDGTVTPLPFKAPGGIVQLRRTWGGDAVAAYTGDGSLLVFSGALDAVQFSFRLKLPTRPLALLWCGPRTLLVHFSMNTFDEYAYDDISFLISTDLHVHSTARAADFNTAPSSAVHIIRWGDEGSAARLVPEVDGVRVVTETTSYFLEEVPQAAVFTQLPAVKQRASQVVAAYHLYHVQKSFDGLLRLKELAAADPDGFDAVLDDVMQAAAHEWDVDAQETLLQAVAFAIPHCNRYDADRYSDAVRRLRLLNALRHPDCGMPLSIQQYETLAGTGRLTSLSSTEAQVVVDRLVNRQGFQMALAVATHMRMRTQNIFVRWACAKVVATKEPASAALLPQLLKKTMSTCPGATYTDAALAAFRTNRTDLAVELLNADPKQQSKVLLFLQMNREVMALERAVEGLDSDLLAVSLIHIFSTMRVSDIASALSGRPEAVPMVERASLFVPSWEAPLEEYFNRAGRGAWGGYRKLQQGLARDAATQRVRSEEHETEETAEKNAAEGDGSQHGSCHGDEAGEDMRDVLHFQDVASAMALGTSGNAQDDQRWIRQHIQLLEIQGNVASAHSIPFIVGQTVLNTIRILIEEGLGPIAADLKTKFNVKDTQFWHVQLRALVSTAQWDELDRLGGATNPKAKSPIGFLPFVEALFEAERFEQMIPFITKLGDIVHQVDWFVRINRYDKAADAAHREDDVGLLRQLLNYASDDATANYIQAYIKDLS